MISSRIILTSGVYILLGQSVHVTSYNNIVIHLAWRPHMTLFTVTVMCLHNPGATTAGYCHRNVNNVIMSTA